MKDDNAKYASDAYELKAMNLIDEVYRHPLRRNGEARAVLLSSHLHLCCEVFKRENDAHDVDPDHSITSIQGVEVAVGEDLEDDEWYVITAPEYEEAVADGRLKWRSFEREEGVSRLPQPGERARILPSEAMDRTGATGRTGVVLDTPGMLIAVRLDDTTGMPPYSAGVVESGMVFCTISEVELEKTIEVWFGGTDAESDERRDS